jgi:hypothetical protein
METPHRLESGTGINQEGIPESEGSTVRLTEVLLFGILVYGIWANDQKIQAAHPPEPPEFVHPMTYAHGSLENRLRKAFIGLMLKYKTIDGEWRVK